MDTALANLAAAALALTAALVVVVARRRRYTRERALGTRAPQHYG